MSDRSSIEWTDSSWNPVRARDGKLGWHCEKVSPGCAHCYAERLNGRLGTGLAYTRGNRGPIDLFLDEKILAAPLRWRKPRKISVCSMSDIFAEFVPDEWIDHIFAVMALAPRHEFQVLTKRANRMREWFEKTSSGATRETLVYESEAGIWDRTHRPAKEAPRWPGWPLPNVWLGISAEDQQRLNERVPELLATPAAVRFVSAEPLLGPLDFRFGSGGTPLNRWGFPLGPHGYYCDEQSAPEGCHDHRRIDWVIVGGESGPGARPMSVACARDIVRQCREAGIAVFCKQIGTHPIIEAADGAGPDIIRRQRKIDAEWPAGTRFGNPTKDPALNGRVVILRDPKGGDPSEWPADLHVREFPIGDPPEGNSQ